VTTPGSGQGSPPRPKLDTYVLVPNAGRRAVLVMGSGERATLPALATGGGAARVVETLRQELALDTPYLRRVQVLRDETRRPVAVLHEVDAPSPEWVPPTGVTWLPLDQADLGSLAPAELSAAIDRWVAEQRGSSVPKARAAWARPGWLAEATGWMMQSARASGLEPKGRPEVVEQWSLSSVLKLETDAGHVYLKAIFPLFWHEPVLTRALAGSQPELVPEVLALDESRGWMLLRELHGEPLGNAPLEQWPTGARVLAHIQLAWVGRDDELRALGAHDRTLAGLASELRELGETARLGAADRIRFAEALPELDRRLDALAASELPETLVHGDFHPWNLMLDGDELRIFDWSDACVASPFFDLPTFVSRAPDEASQNVLLDAYFERWTDVAPLEELRRLYRLAEPLAYLHHAISYERIGTALPPDERWLFEGEPPRWMERALALLDGRSGAEQGGD
jgi:Ser/Thr protein kinase RdoA (MazF antagonist)